jgi:zinc protease
MPVSLTADKSLYFEDNFAKLPELRITFPSVEGYHEDATALNVLARLIAGSKNSALYRKIVETEKLAPNVSAFNNSMEVAGEFVFRVRANAGVDLDTVYTALQEALQDFETNGVDATDLMRIKAEQENGLYSGLATVLGKANQMATDNEFAGDPVHALKEARALNAITADDIMRVYHKYIKDRPAIITSFVPKGQSDLSLTGAELASVWIEEVKAGAASEEVSQGAEAEYAKTPSQYDRSEPPFGDLPLVKMPDVWEAELANNIRLLGIENNEVPLVNYEIVIEGGGMLDPLDKKGLSSMLAGLMNEGTREQTAAELEQAIGLLGAGIRVSASREEIVISVSTLAKNFEATVGLVEDILTAPRFDQAGFDRVKAATLTAVKGREAQPRSIAALNFSKLIYGEKHPLGYAQNGTFETVSAIGLDDVKGLHETIFAMPVKINIAGNIDQGRAASSLSKIAEKFGASTDIKTPSYDVPDQSANAGKVFFIDVPGSKQSVINVGKLTLSSLDHDANKLNFTNEKLGGGISGDLAQTLRIEKGYTYGAFSRIRNGKVKQPFVASTSVRANATKASLEIIRDMIDNYGPDYSEAGVKTTKQKLVKENTRAFESLRAKLGTLRNISKYGKSLKYVEEEQQELLAMTLDDFKTIAGTYLSAGEMIYLIVGDKESQFGPVSEFAGGNVIELDIYGNRLN